MFNPDKSRVYKEGGFWFAHVPGHPPTGWRLFDTAVYWVGCYYTNPGATKNELNRMTNQYRRRLLEEGHD